MALVSRNEDGWGHDLYTGSDLGNINMQSVRASLNYIGSDTFDYYLTGDYTRRREHTRPISIVGLYPSPVINLYEALVGNKLFPGTTLSSFVAANPLDTYAGAPDASNLDVGGVSGIGTWHVSPTFTVKSITAWRAQRMLSDVDYDGTPLPIADYNRTIHETQVSQEIQLNLSALDNRLNLVAGGFFQHENASIGDFEPTLVGLYQAIGLPLGINSKIHQTDDSYAGYANATFKVTDKLGLTAGVRYSPETKNFNEVADYYEAGRSIYVTPTGAALPAGTVVSASKSFNSTTPTAGIQYQATRNAFLYFTYAQGFKSGGFDGRPIAGLSSPSGFAPETVKSYEIGGKFDLLNHKLRTNIALYTMQYNDLQVTAVQTQPTGLAVDVTRNAGRARIRGVELETTYEPIPGLEIQGNGSYTDAQLQKVAAGVPFTINDHLVNTPKWIVNLGVQYTYKLANGAKLIPRVDYSYTSMVYNELPNTYSLNATDTAAVANGPLELPTRQTPYSIVNARVSYTSSGSGLWTVAIFSTNLLDKHYISYGFTSLATGTSLAYFAAPRECGITISRRFR